VKSIKTTIITLFTGLIILLMVQKLSAYDPGNPDSLVIGNLDGSPILAHPGDSVYIPVWFKNDEDMDWFQMPVSTEDQFVSQRLGGVIYDFLTFWDFGQFMRPYLNQPDSGFTMQMLWGFSELVEPWVDSVCNTQGEWLKMADFLVLISDDPANIGQSSQIIEGYHWSAGGILFGSGPFVTWVPVLVFGTIEITSPYEYLPGDANMGVAYWPAMVTNADVTYLVNYLGGKVQPCLFDGIFYASGDANGNCIVTNSDVTYLINYFRGGSAPTYCPSYPPAPPVQETYPLCFMGLLLNSEREHDSDLK
jgi:hypothetical protein